MTAPVAGLRSTFRRRGRGVDTARSHAEAKAKRRLRPARHQVAPLGCLAAWVLCIVGSVLAFGPLIGLALSVWLLPLVSIVLLVVFEGRTRRSPQARTQEARRPARAFPTV